MYHKPVFVVVCVCDFCATAVTPSVNCLAQVGTVQRQIGQVDEAVKSFTQALVLQPNSVLALEGAGEAYLAQAHARTSEGLYTAAFDALQMGCVVTRQFLVEVDAGDSREPSPTGEHQNRRVSSCRSFFFARLILCMTRFGVPLAAAGDALSGVVVVT